MGVPWSLYAAHTLSTWGDNMWWFAGRHLDLKIMGHPVCASVLNVVVFTMLLCILLRIYGTENESIQGAATCWSCSPPLCVSPPSTALSSLLQVRQTLTLS